MQFSVCIPVDNFPNVLVYLSTSFHNIKIFVKMFSATLCFFCVCTLVYMLVSVLPAQDCNCSKHCIDPMCIGWQTVCMLS